MRIEVLGVALAVGALVAPNAGCVGAHNAANPAACVAPGETVPVRPPSRPPAPEVAFGISVDGQTQVLRVRYRQDGSAAFVLEVGGTCNRVVKGIARVHPCWFLGAESDLDGSEGYFVEEYWYGPDETLSLRIDEETWTRATVADQTLEIRRPQVPHSRSISSRQAGKEMPSNWAIPLLHTMEFTGTPSTPCRRRSEVPRRWPQALL